MNGSSPRPDTPAARHVPVAGANDLAPGQRKLAFIDGRSIVLFNIEGEVHALDNSCPHNGASLASGQLEGRWLRCPAHGLRFDVTTGRMAGGAGMCVKTFQVRTQEGRLLVTVETEASSTAARP